ncbi:metal-sulfur cluster assembly factor [Candidatus Woesearchaeota archaeon]|nr:metal-sulfur cluster assembly factor [Candidatus Woesearchaeota archaeon]
MISKEQVIQALKQCEDPELQIDVYTLGLIYDIRCSEEKVDIKMTLTSPMCPYGPWLLNEVETNVKEITNAKEVKIDLVFEPLWQPSEEIKLLLGI